MRRTAFALPVIIALVATGLITSPAVAHDDVPTISSDEVAASQPTTRWVDSEGYVRIPLSELEALASTQTAKEIDGLVNSGRPLNILVDPATGETLAAAVAEKSPNPEIIPFAITTGCGTPGHATAGRYVAGGGYATCFNGSGTLWISLPNTYYLSGGDRDTTFIFQGGGGSIIAWGGWSVTFPAPTSYDFQTVQR